MKVYIAHPLRGDSSFEVLANIWRALRYGAQAMKEGHRPVVTHPYALPGILNPFSQEDDELARAAGLAEVRHCDQLWVCGPRVTTGMQAEIHLAEKLDIPVIVRTEIP